MEPAVLLVGTENMTKTTDIAAILAACIRPLNPSELTQPTTYAASPAALGGWGPYVARQRQGKILLRGSLDD